MVKQNTKKYILIPASKYADQMTKQLRDLGVASNEFGTHFNSTIPEKELRIEVQLVEHCNLKCKYCTHMSPLAKEEYLSCESYERDIGRVSELTGGKLKRLLLLGGEPLLHPNIVDICKLSRKYIREGKIEIVTNGLLLAKMPIELWNVCKDNDIEVGVTEYPINLDYQGIFAKIKSYGVNIYSFGKITNDFWRYQLAEDGNYDVDNAFEKCAPANACNMLAHGKIYPCPVPGNIRHLNAHMGTNFEESELDGIDIYKAESKEEILQFLARPIPFCRYCDVDGRLGNQPWTRTGFEREEWIKS